MTYVETRARSARRIAQRISVLTAVLAPNHRADFQWRFFASASSQSAIMSRFARHHAGPCMFIWLILSVQLHFLVGPSPTSLTSMSCR